MAKITILGYPSFEVPLTAADVDVLMKLSADHYDYKCREASSLRGGFIYGWRNIAESWEPAPPDEPTIRAEWRQLDLCLKIMELAGYARLPKAEHAIVTKLQRWFNTAMDAASKTKWQLEVEVE